jgi:hypothetical protein
VEDNFMTIDVTGTSETIETATLDSDGVDLSSEAFGTRPRNNRPHSISLFGSHRRSRRDAGARTVDLLIGVGIGAAAMYYLVRQR